MKKLISFILILSVICSMSNVSAIDLITSRVTEKTNSWDTPSNKYNKLHFYFLDNDYSTVDDQDEMEAAFESLSSANVLSSTYNTSEPLSLNVTIQFASHFANTDEYIELVNARSELESIEDIHKWREELNSFSELYHNDLIEQNISHIENLGYADYETIRYSPFVVLKMSTSEINIEDFSELIESEDVSHISFDYEPVPASEMTWNETLTTINARSIVNNGTYTGEGIRIGILEAGGICDTSHASLENIDITFNNFEDLTEEQTDEDDHATNVTSILYSIAPEAEYFFNLTADTISLEWFIDNNCDIVNCSWGYSGAVRGTEIDDGEFQYIASTSNEYEMDKDGLYDYQVQHHFITVVKSAGNVSTVDTSPSFNPNGLITNPGFAYNVITVGGIDFQDDDSSGISHHEGAAYISGSNSIKPNISAPYVVEIPGVGEERGTSYAAPQVAASIALLYQSRNQLMAYPEAAMAIVTASASETDDYDNDDEFIDERVGTGVIDVDEMIDIATNRTYDTELNEEGELDEVFSISIDLDEGDILQVSSTWIVRVSSDDDDAPTEIHFTDYDMVLLDPDGDSIESSMFGDKSNVEFIRYEIEEDGEYTMVVDIWGTFEFGDNDKDWLAIAYCIK